MACALPQDRTLWSELAPQHIALIRAPQYRFDSANGIAVSAATQPNGTFAASVRSIIVAANVGLVAKPISSGTWAADIRTESSVHAFGR
jgi:hypothetical protein